MSPPSSVVRSKKRVHDGNEVVDLISPSTLRPRASTASDSGLDLEWALALDQEEEKDYLPPRLGVVDVDALPYKGEHVDEPLLEDDNDFGEYTYWVLARVRSMCIAVRWIICFKRHYKDRTAHYRKIKLETAPASNHEESTKRIKKNSTDTSLSTSSPSSDLVPLKKPQPASVQSSTLPSALDRSSKPRPAPTGLRESPKQSSKKSSRRPLPASGPETTGRSVSRIVKGLREQLRNFEFEMRGRLRDIMDELDDIEDHQH
ncbi:hypothetical protein M426DRAFT_12138 [Hypoxylon sp. CI-4A]|nr:hypothetical protein M426DRAFT_12138 [Hypoxylon sp. CI-4A]